MRTYGIIMQDQWLRVNYNVCMRLCVMCLFITPSRYPPKLVDIASYDALIRDHEVVEEDMVMVLDAQSVSNVVCDS